MGALIVVLPNTPAGPAAEYDFAVCSSTAAVLRHGRAPLGALPPAGGSVAEVVVVAAAAMLSWHALTLPRGTAANGPRLRQVLEGLLEEHLLDEPSSLHLAWLPGANGNGWAGACDRAWLAGHLKALEASGRAAQRIVAEAAPQISPAGAPAAASMLWIHGDEAQPQALYADPQGVVCAPLAAPLWPAWPQGLTVLAEPAVAACAEALGRPVRLQTRAQHWVQAWQTGADLAQGEFATRGGRRVWQRLRTRVQSLLHAPQWRPLRWGIGLLLVAQLAGLNAWAYRERSALAAKQDAIHRTLMERFPNVQVVIDAPVQMERELALLRQATGAPGPRDLAPLLAAVAAAVPAGRVPAALEYDGQTVRVSGLGLAAPELESLARQLSAHGRLAAVDGDVLTLRVAESP